MNWHSSSMMTTNNHDSSVTGSQVSTRSTWSSHIRPTQENQDFPAFSQEDVTQKLQILAKVMEETLAENNSLEKEIISLLKHMDIDPQSLSYETNTNLEKAGAILKNQNLSEFDESALLFNMEREKREQIVKGRNERALKRRYEELCTRYAKMQEKVMKVQEKVQIITDIIDCSRENSEVQYSETVQNATKLNDYKRVIDNLEEELAGMSMSDDGPEPILAKYKHCLGATGELAELTKSLNLYGDLPPDIRQAKAVVEQTEKRRQEIKYLLDKKMGK